MSDADPMRYPLVVDRFEGGWAVVELDDGTPFELPRHLLPEGVGEGDRLTLELRADPSATAQARREVRQRRDRLRADDDGGDLSL